MSPSPIHLVINLPYNRPANAPSDPIPVRLSRAIYTSRLILSFLDWMESRKGKYFVGGQHSPQLTWVYIIRLQSSGYSKIKTDRRCWNWLARSIKSSASSASLFTLSCSGEFPFSAMHSPRCYTLLTTCIYRFVMNRILKVYKIYGVHWVHRRQRRLHRTIQNQRNEQSVSPNHPNPPSLYDHLGQQIRTDPHYWELLLHLGIFKMFGP